LAENNLKDFSDSMTGNTGFDRIAEFQKLLTQAFATRKGQVEKARLSQASLQ
jgi:hypothetical protein